MATTSSTASNEISHYAGLLALELDPQRADFSDVPPEPLSVATATALAGHLAKDLDRILDGIHHLGLILPGALYDQTEILRPGFPLIDALTELYSGSDRDRIFKPRLIALGSDTGLPIRIALASVSFASTGAKSSSLRSRPAAAARW